MNSKSQGITTWTSTRYGIAYAKYAILFLLLLLFFTTLIEHENITPVLITSRNLEAIRKLSPTPTTFPRSFHLEPIGDVPLPKSACFLSCIKRTGDTNDLICHFREHHRKQIIGTVILDGQSFRIKSPIVRDAVAADFNETLIYSPSQKTLTENVLYGEDPRSFMWDGEHYVLNHYGNNYNTLVQVADDGTAKFETKLPDFLGDKHTTPVPVSGKGLIFIDFENEKIHVCIRTGYELGVACEPFWKDVVRNYKKPDEKNWESKDDHEWSYRGGTPGFEIKPGLFVGFGHAVPTDGGSDIHRHRDIYHWRFDMRPEVARIFIDRMPINHNLDFGITYPTGMVEMDKQWYLFTVESTSEWDEVDVVFTNRIYQIAGRKCPRFGYCNGKI